MHKQTHWAVLLICAVFLSLFPNLFGIYYANILVSTAIWALFAVSLNMLLGYTGLLSFGHAMYFGTGAYGTALALTHMESLSMIPAVLLGAFCAVILSLLVAPLVVRTSGTAFAMLHLAFAQCLFMLALKLRGLTGGEDGIGGFDMPPLSLAGLFSIDMNDPVRFYYMSLAIISLTLFVLWFITKTPFGQIMAGVRDNSKRIEHLGFRVPHTKALAYVISACAAGIAGAVNALNQNLVAVNDAYGMMISMFPIMIVMIGGVRSFFGPVFGAIFFTLIGEISSAYTDKFELILGLTLIVFIMYRPLGIAGIFMKIKLNWHTRKRFLRKAKEGMS